MRDWIVITVLYVLGMGVFRLVGGLGSAGDAFRRWGESVSGDPRDAASSG